MSRETLNLRNRHVRKLAPMGSLTSSAATKFMSSLKSSKLPSKKTLIRLPEWGDCTVISLFHVKLGTFSPDLGNIFITV